MKCDGLLQLPINEHGAVENPYIASHLGKFRKPWGGYVSRRFDKVQVARNAFLQRDTSGRLIAVVGVPTGSYLGFGAEIQGSDNNWAKGRYLYQVIDRDSSLLTLRQVSEIDIPALNEINYGATLAHLEAELDRNQEHLQWLTLILKQVRADTDLISGIRALS